MFRSAERGRRLGVVGRAILLVALLGLWGMPSEAQDRVARPGADEVAVLTYPLVVKVQPSERRLTPTGMVTSTRSYSEALVSASNPARTSAPYCALTRVTNRGEWPCGAVQTGSVVAVAVAVGGLSHRCQAQVPKVVAAPRLVLSITIHGGTTGAPIECGW
ncbi:MAG: hypothetical protein IT352_04335 [Gemmatimonadales bacterium]|nr:hypothetical protein [Gemmatimonadales bacterium]